MSLAALEPAPVAEQHHKLVTVLFAYIFGFTAMRESMDTEDVTVMVATGDVKVLEERLGET